jgi:hypothetical protein
MEPEYFNRKVLGRTLTKAVLIKRSHLLSLAFKNDSYLFLTFCLTQNLRGVESHVDGSTISHNSSQTPCRKLPNLQAISR